MNNKELKQIITTNGLYLWQVAEALGITDSTFSRKLRKELTDDEKNNILRIVEELREAAVND